MNFRKKNIKETQKELRFKQIYQNADGTYLPDSSQPNPDKDYEITTQQYTPHKSTRYMNVTIGSNGLPQRKDKNGDIVECDKALPEIYENRENCCGCTACYAVCPFEAIVMRPCEEGFLYPVVDAEKCVRCYKCLSVCAFKDGQHEKGYLKN